jgi:hypothetical protein
VDRIDDRYPRPVPKPYPYGNPKDRIICGLVRAICSTYKGAARTMAPTRRSTGRLQRENWYLPGLLWYKTSLGNVAMPGTWLFLLLPIGRDCGVNEEDILRYHCIHFSYFRNQHSPAKMLKYCVYSGRYVREDQESTYTDT